jgi:hypothetical protein
MRAHRLFLIAAVVAGALAAAPATAAAQCDDDTEGEKKQAFHVEVRNGEKVYVIDQAISVCGKVPRPNVVYVLLPRSINYEWENLKKDFLPKIIDAVKRTPF